MYTYIFFYVFISGVAIGAGWQALVAYVNISCYYIFGIPLGLILGFKVKLGVKVSQTRISYSILCFDQLFN